MKVYLGIILSPPTFTPRGLTSHYMILPAPEDRSVKKEGNYNGQIVEVLEYIGILGGINWVRGLAWAE